MKYLVIAGVVGLFACAGYQAKLEDAKTKANDLKEAVECRADVVKPYLEYVTGEDLVAVLEGADIKDLLEMAGVAKTEFEAAKAAFAACGDLSLK